MAPSTTCYCRPLYYYCIIWIPSGISLTYWFIKTWPRGKYTADWCTSLDEQSCKLLAGSSSEQLKNKMNGCKMEIRTQTIEEPWQIKFVRKAIHRPFKSHILWAKVNEIRLRMFVHFVMNDVAANCGQPCSCMDNAYFSFCGACVEDTLNEVEWF